MAQFDAKVKGIAAYVHVDTPDKPKWDTGGKTNYVITVRGPKAKMAEVCKQILAMNKAEFKERAKGAYKPFGVDDDGIVSIKAKSQYQPAVYDVHGKPMEFPTRMAAGSLVNVAMSFKTFSTNKKLYGTTAYLNGVQALKLRKWVPTNSRDGMFGDASGDIGAEDEEMFEAFEAAQEDDDDEGGTTVGTGTDDEDDDEDLSAADF